MGKEKEREPVETTLLDQHANLDTRENQSKWRQKLICQTVFSKDQLVVFLQVSNTEAGHWRIPQRACRVSSAV